MPHENKKSFLLPKCTGTIPKVKLRNNNASASSTSAKTRSNLLSNNLGDGRNGHETTDCNQESSQNHNRNSRLYTIMDPLTISHENPNGLLNLSNGSSSTTNNSRRNSAGLSKCDNVTKYPDKKQIENKLTQIQEYLQVAQSMRANMRRTDEQMQNTLNQYSKPVEHEDAMAEQQLESVINDLQDSETKLRSLLFECDASNQFSEHGFDQIDQKLEHKVDTATRDLQMLKEQENVLLHLQLSAETQLREAKLAQAKLAHVPAALLPRNASNMDADWFNTSDMETMSNSGSISIQNVASGMDFRELEDRIKGFHIEDIPKLQSDQYQPHIDHLLHRINHIRENNENRAELTQILNARDAQLQAQHCSLQGKLKELQNKKQQVDQLVHQLQNMNEETEDDDEVGCQVKKIVNMKEQLAKLKDMLSLVQNTENGLDVDGNNEMHLHEEIEENVNRLIAKTDNLMHQNRVPHVENVANACGRANYASMSSNEHRMKEKQINKKSMNANEKERMKIQAELRAKRKELEELMCKHRAANSNLNHDVNSEKNSEHATFDLNEWVPIESNIFNTPAERVSSESDECVEPDANEYSEMNLSNDFAASVMPMPLMNFPPANYMLKRFQESMQGPRVELPHESTASSRSPARSVPAFTPAIASNRCQLQKQLELIKSVCDSMLMDASSTSRNECPQNANIRVRNNLTPSPNYMEQVTNDGNTCSRNMARRTNEINNSTPMNNVSSPPTISPNDSNAYNNLLATNTLQTQAFIVNTLNQCCQMLWHQQKELATLRTSVNMIQDAYCSPSFHDGNTPLYMQSNPCIFPSGPPSMQMPHGNVNYLLNNFRHSGQAPKMNAAYQQSSLNTGSMPNLNGHCAHPTHSSSPLNTNNLEHACCNNLLTNNVMQQPNSNSDEQQQLNSSNLPAMWNRQALNNQVPPGNRANNYWDNFRSYSRQNLLSTKNNEGTQQNGVGDASKAACLRMDMNFSPEQVAAGLVSTSSKSNSAHNEPENTGRRRQVPDSQISIAERRDSRQGKDANSEIHSVAVATSSEEQKDEFAEARAASPSLKGMEDVNEFVYKEVVSLISANEHNPHFLVQLFRELQHISSDYLRHKTLQTIRNVVRNSENSTSQEDACSEFELLTIHLDRDLVRSASNSNLPDSSQQETRAWSPARCQSSSHDDRLMAENQEQFKTMASYFNINAEEGIWMDGWSFNVNKPLMYDLPTPRILKEIENDNLAEADQSRVVADDEDEGAVGGLLNILERSSSSIAGHIHSQLEEDIPFIEAESDSEHGLDEVPTRLSNQPSLGCSPKSQ